MQYLPGILKLQRHLFDCFHQQIGQEKALCETIGEYKKRLQKGTDIVNNLKCIASYLLPVFPYIKNDIGNFILKYCEINIHACIHMYIYSQAWGQILV